MQRAYDEQQQMIGLVFRCNKKPESEKRIRAMENRLEKVSVLKKNKKTLPLFMINNEWTNPLRCHTRSSIATWEKALILSHRQSRSDIHKPLLHNTRFFKGFDSWSIPKLIPSIMCSMSFRAGYLRLRFPLGESHGMTRLLSPLLC